MLRICILCISLFVVALLPNPGLAADPVRISTCINPPLSTEDQTGFLDLLLAELSKRTGQRVELVRLPPKRALEAVNEGTIHGEMPHIVGFEKQHSNLMMVDEPLLKYHFVGFCRESVEVKSWADLSGKRVGYVEGWLLYEESLPEGVEGLPMADPEAMLEMLDLDRIDVALYERHAGWEHVRREGHVYLRECGPPLAVMPMYLYFNSSQSELVPLFERALKIMKEDGTYEAIFAQTLK